MRRFTRLTNAFSKKVENYALMVAVFTAYYNFCRPHQALAVRCAMVGGLYTVLPRAQGRSLRLFP